MGKDTVEDQTDEAFGKKEIEPNLLNKVTDFFSRERGLERSQKLEDNIKYFLGPYAGSLGQANQLLNPIVGIQDAGEATREGRYLDAVTDTAGAALPIAGAVAAKPLAKGVQAGIDKAVDAVTEVMTGFKAIPDKTDIERMFAKVDSGPDTPPPVDPDPYGRFGMNADSLLPDEGALTLPKKEVSPLFRETQTVIDKNKPVDFRDPKNTTFYSPVLTALQNLPIGKDGMLGSNIIKFLKKRAPNINKTELNWSQLLYEGKREGVSEELKGIDPNVKYTKDEILKLADKNLPEVRVDRASSMSDGFASDGSAENTVWKGTQRVKVALYKQTNGTNIFKRNIQTGGVDEGSEYVELRLINDNPLGQTYRKSRAHWSDQEGNKVIAHVRGSYFDVQNKQGQSQKVFVAEEMQSDAAQKHTIATEKTTKETKDRNEGTAISPFKEQLKKQFRVIDEGIGSEGTQLSDRFNRYAGIDQFDFAEEMTEKVNLAFDQISEDINLVHESFNKGDVNLKQVADFLSGQFKIKDTAVLRGLDASFNDEQTLTKMYSNVIGDLLYTKSVVKKMNLESEIFKNVEKVFKQNTAKNDLTPAGLGDTVRLSLLTMIKDAKNNGSNTIVIPPIKDLAQAHQASLIQKTLSNTYETSVVKALKRLKSETNGKINFKKDKLFGLRFPSKQNYMVIDITDLQINDKDQIRFAEGGSVSAMNNQTEMMLEEGGIADDGMNRDPVSGNQIPPGSMAKEVRDDVPANLSEGEYVVPADVVRFFGVKYFEDLRVQAKQGLQQMDKDGRIGGEPTTGAPPSGGGEISEEELMLILKEELGKEAPQGQPSPQPKPQPKPIGMMNKGGYASTSMASYRKNFNAGGVVNAAEGVDVNPKYVPSNRYGESNVGTGSGMTSVPYENDSGDVMYFTFINGRLYPRGITIPTGFRPMSGYEDLVPASQQVGPVTPTTTEPTPEVNKDSDPKPETETDSTAWMDKFEFDGTNEKIINNAKNILNSAGDSDFAIKGLSLLNPVAGIFGLADRASAAAQVAGVLISLNESMMKDEDGKPIKNTEWLSLKGQLDEFKTQYGLDKLPKELINGDMFAKQINATKDVNDFALGRNAIDLDGNPIFKNDAQWNKQMELNAPTGMVYNPDLVVKGLEETGGYTRDTDPFQDIQGITAIDNDNEGPNVYQVTDTEAAVASGLVKPRLRDPNTEKPKPKKVAKKINNKSIGPTTTGGKPTGGVEYDYDYYNKGGLITKRKKKK
tara:strand:+ start:357 stop:4085 length:3729 start_codon:yes stop_codon:yes gene_type:complete